MRRTRLICNIRETVHVNSLPDPNLHALRITGFPAQLQADRYHGGMVSEHLRLYDTKTQQKRIFTPLTPGRVQLYLCGPTVQGAPHVGHLRAAVNFDVLVRWLFCLGYQVTYVRNVTDIDDKILNKSMQEGAAWWAHAAKYERLFQRAYRELGNLPPTVEPRATGHISDQIELVQRLIERGHAYPDGQGNVYFDVHSQEDYGSLTHQSLEQMRFTEGEGDEAAAGTTAPSGKRDPRDFALWKAAKEGEPETASWRSPWGRGRPGWHLECSAMAHRYLGEEFDIHGGGLDLRFPHHENEQAQSHAAGWGFAQFWMHNAWVTMAGEKMSKSLGNTTQFFELAKEADPAVIRLALAGVHYRSTIEWSEQTLGVAAQTWDKFAKFVEEAAALVTAAGKTAGAPGAPGAASAALLDASAVADATSSAQAATSAGDAEEAVAPVSPELAAAIPAEFAAAMNDDLNVAAALAVVHEHVKRGRSLFVAAKTEAEAATQLAEELQAVRAMLGVLGLDPFAAQWRAFGHLSGNHGPQSGSGDSNLEQAVAKLTSNLLDLRQQARSDKDWALADRLRDALTQAGFVVEDTPAGATCHLPRS